MSVIELNGISKSVNGKLILSPTTLSINKGDFFALVGGPSSGKSVVLDIMMNFVSPSSGTASIFDMDCNKKSSRIRKNVGYCAKDPDFCHDMRIADLLVMCSKMRRVKKRTLTKELCDIFDINAAMRLSKIGLSDRKIVGLIIAMMHSPEVLLLDSPFYGLDKVSRYKLQKVLSDLNKNGTTIFMTTEDITIAQEICSRAAAMHQGTMLDINEQDKLIKSDTRRISIKTDDDISALLVLFNIKEVFTKKGYISFLYKNDINDLIQALTSYHIDDLQISLPELSEVLSDYYENELEQEQNNVILTYNEPDEPVKTEVTEIGTLTDIDTAKTVTDSPDNNAESNYLAEDISKQASSVKGSSDDSEPVAVQSEIAEELSIDTLITDIPIIEDNATETEFNVEEDNLTEKEAIVENSSSDNEVTEDISTEEKATAEDNSSDNEVAENISTEEKATTEDSSSENNVTEDKSTDKKTIAEDNSSDISEPVNDSIMGYNYDNDLLRRLQEEDMKEQLSSSEEATDNKENTTNNTTDKNAYNKKKDKGKKHKKSKA